MLFNSIYFVLFLPIVFFGYWFLFRKSVRFQNSFLLTASYFFYACWDYRFLFLLMFSTLLDYLSGLQMERVDDRRVKRFWFWLSILINLGFLGVFKYYNFFAGSMEGMLGRMGLHASFPLIKVILPVGISFYTFHGLSYVIDIYKGRIKAVRNFVDYAVFVSFFPLLVAGPIERATHLLPQLQVARRFDYSKAVDGLRQILWGLFKKVVIADNCATLVNDIFEHHATFSSPTLALGAVLFAFQIYGDFSGYSDIALGTARLFGIDLLRNFAYPYFSRDIAEFWRRWHISLSSWFRDYLYIPLGGSRVSIARQVRNTFIIFAVSGFWHGANWTFVAWGVLNAIYFLPLLLIRKNRTHLEIAGQGRMLPSIREFVQIVFTFALVCIAWVFFRAEHLSVAKQYLVRLFSFRSGEHIAVPLIVIGGISLLVVVEWLQRSRRHGLEFTGLAIPAPLRWGIYFSIAFLVGMYFGSNSSFIYFQF